MLFSTEMYGILCKVMSESSNKIRASLSCFVKELLRV